MISPLCLLIQMFYGITFNRSRCSAGRIDRKIEFPLPDEKTKRRIFQIHTSRMTVADDVTLDDLIMAKDDLSGADIKVRDRPQQLNLNSPPVLIKHILTDNSFHSLPTFPPVWTGKSFFSLLHCCIESISQTSSSL